MAVATEFLYRNYDSSDATISTAYSNELFPTIENVGWAAQAGHIFKEWNTSRDGTGASFDPGDSFPSPASYTTFYAIWEECDVSISYKGSAIATMSASGTKTLETEGKYCEDDITVTYTKTAGSASTPATTITANPSISVSSGGLITASVSASQSVTPTVSAGYVSDGTAGTVSVSGSNTQQLTTQAAQTITPTTTNQTIASGKYLTGTQTILGDANLLAENIKKDVVIFGITGTYEGDVPSGYTVTVSLTNPSHPGSFGYCHIYEALSNDLYDWGNEIGSISSPTGSTEITVPASVYGICVELSGTAVYTEISYCTCTGGVSVEETDYEGTFLFSVSGNGTITINGVDYAD